MSSQLKPHPQTPSKASITVAAASIVSRLFGLLRDVVIAHLFGATAALDAFLVAFKLPNLLRRLFAEGAFAQGLVPVLASATQPRQLWRELTGTLILLVSFLIVIVEIFAPQWVNIFAPGFAPNSAELALTTHLLRIIFPFLGAILLSALASALLNVKRRFALAAISPLWLNLMTLLAAIWLAPHLAEPITALAWGIVIGGIIQSLFLFIPLIYSGLITWPSWSPPLKKNIAILFKMLPAVIGVSIGQLGLMVDVILASFLSAGSISFLFYADRLMSLPVAVIGVAVSSAVLPYLTTHATNHDNKAYYDTLQWGVRIISVLGLPAALGLILLAEPIVTTLLKSGHFLTQDVVMVQSTLIAFAGSIPALMLIKVLAASFNARKQFFIPCVITCIAVGLNALLGALWMTTSGHIGLAWATTVAVNMNMLVLWCYGFYQHRTRWSCSLKYPLQLTLALASLYGWLAWQTPQLATWLDWTCSARWLHLLWLIFSGIIVYVVTLAVVGLRPHFFSHSVV